MPQVVKEASHGLDLDGRKTRRPENPPQTESRKTIEIKRLLVLVPSLGGGQVKAPAGPHDSPEFADHRRRILDMLQDLGVQDEIERCGSKRQRSQIPNHVQSRVVPVRISRGRVDRKITSTPEEMAETPLSRPRVQDDFRVASRRLLHKVSDRVLQGMDAPLEELGHSLVNREVEPGHGNEMLSSSSSRRRHSDSLPRRSTTGNMRTRETSTKGGHWGGIARLLALAILFAWMGPPLLASRPNVVLFTIDSCRADRFGTYGYARDTTPRIDHWARTGTVFMNAYSVSAWTAPGLASLLTGLYPPVHGVNNRDRMGSEEMHTLPRLFRSLGYRVPNLNFFTFAPYYLNLGLGEIERRYFGEMEEEALLNWMEQNLVVGDERPFFLWFHTTLVHQPYRPPPDQLPAPLSELEKRPGIRAAMRGAIVPLGSTEFEPDDRPYLDALYDAEVRRADRLFGEMLDRLRDLELLDSTLVMVTADHGEELLDHGFIGHASTSLQAKLYEEIVRIPLMVSWPGRVPSGAVIGAPVSQIDVFPTLVRLFDLESPPGLQGIDLFRATPDRLLFFESVIAGNQTPKDRENEWIQAVRRGRWKYISTGELYDLLLDPEEKNSLADSKSALATELRGLIEGWLDEGRSLARRLFPEESGPLRVAVPTRCPRIHTPGDGTRLDYDVHTGALLFDWSGDMETVYLIEYDIGLGDHHVAGIYEVEGNHQILGPFPRELWGDLKAWNPFRIRVSPKQDPPCWSDWVEFQF